MEIFKDMNRRDMLRRAISGAALLAVTPGIKRFLSMEFTELIFNIDCHEFINKE